VALAWLIAQPSVTAPIASATDLDQLAELLKAAQLRLDEAAIAALGDASREPLRRLRFCRFRRSTVSVTWQYAVRLAIARIDAQAAQAMFSRDYSAVILYRSCYNIAFAERW
jgi:hypothetical protein